MEAPDKIYIHEASALELAEPVLKEYHIEYIRKDALLEWAKDMKHIYELPVHNHQANELCRTKADAFQIVVDKIESL